MNDPEGVAAVGDSHIWICGDTDDSILILVRLDTNQPPVADAGPNQTVSEATQVALDGSASSDPDEDPITFSWEQLSGPNVALSNPTSAMASFTSPEVSEDTTLIFQLTVSDGQLSDQDQVSILVTSENLPPVADAGPDQEVEERAEVFLDGRASSDPNGDAISFQWEQLSGPLVTIAAPRSAVASFIAPRVDADTCSCFVSRSVTGQPRVTTRFLLPCFQS